MIRIDLLINDPVFFTQLRDKIQFKEHILLTLVEDKVFSLSGEEIVSFIAISIGQGLAYDIFLQYANNFILSLKQYYSLNKKSFKVIVNGITYVVKGEEDVDDLLQAIIEDLDQLK